MATLLTARTKAIATAQLRVWVVAILIAVSLQAGCTVSPKCKEECEPATESLLEMALLGVTITTESGPFPAYIDTSVNYGDEEYISTNQLVIYFAPNPEFKTDYDFSFPEEELNGYPYEFFYSYDDGAGFSRIEPSQQVTKFGYTSNLTHSSASEGLYSVDGSDHVLINRVVSIPSKATHIELWHRTELNVEPTLVRRVPLTSLFAWQTYFQPIIEASR